MRAYIPEGKTVKQVIQNDKAVVLVVLIITVLIMYILDRKV